MADVATPKAAAQGASGRKAATAGRSGGVPPPTMSGPGRAVPPPTGARPQGPVGEGSAAAAATPRSSKEAAASPPMSSSKRLSDLKGQLEMSLKAAEDKLNTDMQMLSLDRRFQAADWLSGARGPDGKSHKEEAGAEREEQARGPDGQSSGPAAPAEERGEAEEEAELPSKTVELVMAS